MKAIELPLEQLAPQYKVIVDFIRGNNRQALIELIHDWVNQSNTSFAHPALLDIKGSPCSSHYERQANIIFFRDENSSNRFAIIQVYSAIDAIWCEQGWFYLPSYDYTKRLCQNISTRLNSGFYDSHFLESKYESSFTINQHRPAHCLFDQLSNVVRLFEVEKPTKLIENTTYLTLPAHLAERFIKEPRCDRSQIIYWLPTSIIADKYYEPMWRYLEEKKPISATNRPNEERDPSKTIRIWFGASSMKRRWLEQLDACELIAHRLRALGFTNIEIFIDGITSPSNTKLDSPIELAFFESVKQHLYGKADVINMVGATYDQKLAWGQSCSGFICSAGTPTIIPNIALRLPGVIHSNTHYWDHQDVTYNTKAVYVEFDRVTNILDKKRKMDYLDYSIEPSYVVNLLLHRLGLLSVPT